MGQHIQRAIVAIGEFVQWASLVMVILVLAVVVARYGFEMSLVAVDEAARWLHATLFLLFASCALAHDRHVRVDILARRWSKQTKARIELAGTLVFLLPVCAVIMIYSWEFVALSYTLRETSSEPGGLHALYLLKGMLPLAAFLLFLQGIAELLKHLPAAFERADRPDS